jgi:transcriptional regulator with XRE-family HTH domain
MMSFEEIVPNERLRRARDLRGWTQADLAEALGTDFETVSRWERGIIVPSSYYREKLCTVLGKTAEELGLRSEHVDMLTTSTHSYVFLAVSFADAELEFVAHLRANLQARGMTILSSRAVKRLGSGNMRKVLQEGVRAAQMVLVVASPAAQSSRHVQVALQLAKIYQRPVCAIWIAGESRQMCMPKDSDEPYTMIDGRKGYDLTLIDEIVATLERAQLAPDMPSPETSRAAREQPTQPRNPYKGLQAFQREDAQDFFGRESLIDTLVASLEASLLVEKQYNQSARMLAVIGPSGSGKSSVVMAGLLPRLQSGGLPESEKWIYLDPIVPGLHPVDSLAVAFAEQLPTRSLHTIRDDLEYEFAEGLHLLATALAGWQDTKVLLVLDQFEELFTLTASEDERQHFLALLLNAVTEPRGPVVVVLTLRADFFDRPMYYSELGQLIESHHTLVFAMDITALRAVIEQPASLPDVQLVFEDDLVGDLLFEMQGQSSALPLLQFTLDQLYQRRNGHHLTLRAYHEIGGVKGALVKHAEAIYAALPSEEHRGLARALFVRLIDPGMTDQDIMRRRAALTEFVLDDPTRTRLLRETIDTFIAARLLSTDTRAGFATVEVSHEALIREWPRLSNWLQVAREDIRLQQLISEDVAEWERRGKPRDRLYHGSQFKEAQAWARRNIPSANETAFLRASASRRMWYVISVLAMVFLILSTTGISLGLLLRSMPSLTVVTTLNDDGPGSLRQAIASSRQGGTITFDPGLRGTIIMNHEGLDLAKDLSIRGPGEGLISISSSDVNGGVNGGPGYNIYVSSSAIVAMSGLTFKNSKQWTSSFLINEGTLTLSNSLVTDNTLFSLDNIPTDSILATSAVGGGITNTGTLILNNSSVSGNAVITRSYPNTLGPIHDTFNRGGGIANTGTLMLNNSSVSDNRVDGSRGAYGGGIYNGFSGSITLNNSTVAGNVVASQGTEKGVNNFFDPPGGYGGGIYNAGTLSLNNSTVSRNSASTGGGGIFEFGSSQAQSYITMLFCTIYGNSAKNGGGISMMIPGETIASGPVQVQNSIIAGNQADGNPDISGILSTFVQKDGGGAAPPSTGGAIITDGYNLIQNIVGVSFADPMKKHSTDIVGTTFANLLIDPQLRDNGGITQPHTLTLALYRDSSAIDRIPLADCLLDGITADQRGVKRPDDHEATCDIGAYESTD